MTTTACFKAYDIRGKVPEELDTQLAYQIGRAYAQVVAPTRPIAIGWDARDSSPELAAALIRGLNDAGIDTRELGLAGTEVIYFAAGQEEMGGGIMVTASHNPLGYNGMKLVREEARPISGDTGLNDIRALVESGDLDAPATTQSTNQKLDLVQRYVDHVLGFVDRAQLAPLHLLANPGNGAAGPYFDAVVAALPFKVTRIQHEPDPTFPNGIPNPLLPEMRHATADAVRESGADMGIAWDGDFDRCFLFDENGKFIEGYYIVGLLAAQLLETHAGEKIIHDPRLTWNTIEMVTSAGGVPVQSKTGHAFIKERMRSEDAIYGGEMSAHHYFRDFFYCDSGMIPWLLVAEFMGKTGLPLSQLVADREARFPCSGEINFTVGNTREVIAAIEGSYAESALKAEYVDGLSMEFEDWRFNVRASNTEPVLRLNVESRGDAALMQTKTAELTGLITTH